MTWVVFIILAGLAVGFGLEAEEWRRRADFWERAYMDRAVKLEALVDLSDEYAEESQLLRVYPKDSS